MRTISLRRAGLVLVLLGLALIIAFMALQGQTPSRPAVVEATAAAALPRPPTPVPHTPTPEPLVPTATSGPPVTVSPEASPQVARPITTTERTAVCPLDDCRQRAGVSGQPFAIMAAYAAGLHFGTYLSWSLLLDPPRPERAAFWQMIKVGPDGPLPSWEAIAETIQANPGAVWIVGNEPDVIWQDNLTPEQYAAVYHDVYAFLKERDPGAQVAVAGVAQSTPLRLAYLDRVLSTYQNNYGAALPVDIWTVHGFVLREEAGSWGVDIPPGLDETTGRLYDIEDHDDLTVFRQNLLDFRAWMASRGYGDKPLAMTEFGILLPNDYGFPSQAVADFLVGALEILTTTTSEHGYAADEGRLVQWWHWYSVYDEFNYPTGNLYDPKSGALTPLGLVYAAYIGE